MKSLCYFMLQAFGRYCFPVCVNEGSSFMNQCVRAELFSPPIAFTVHTGRQVFVVGTKFSAYRVVFTKCVSALKGRCVLPGRHSIL